MSLPHSHPNRNRCNDAAWPDESAFAFYLLWLERFTKETEPCTPIPHEEHIRHALTFACNELFGFSPVELLINSRGRWYVRAF